MSTFRDKSFLSSVKGKVIFGYFIASLALSASWFISKLAFEDMQVKLATLSQPNDKLRHVNKVFREIVLLDQMQNALPHGGEQARKELLVQSTYLVRCLDSLKDLSVENPLQIIRIDSMKKILRAREGIYGNYVDVRSKLVSNKDLSDQVKSISGMITTNQKRPDSTVVKTEKKVTTTTIYTSIPDSQQKAEVKKSGLLKRVFGKKQKKEAETVKEAPKIVQKQEVKIEVDTLTVAKEDSTIEKVGQVVHDIEKAQKMRTDRFVDREQQLASAGNTLVSQLLGVMRNVERDVMKDNNIQNSQTQKLVTATVDKIKWVALGFFFVIALLSYLILADITKSNAYRSQLEEAKEEAEYHSMAKQRFLSNMSHEIRTPLQSIIGYSEVLKNSPNPKKQDLETIHSASEHLLYLINDVLDYSRIISNQFSFEKRVFAISPLLEEVIQMLRPTASSKTLLLSLENTLDKDLHLEGDPFRLRQILYNLLTNAIKFTEHGEVILKAGGKQHKANFNLTLEIVDTGIGLSKEQQHRVFNQFEQADPSIARKYGGSGLGLSIVKSLVDAMKGQIKVSSKLGEGTVFTIAVALKKAQPIQSVVAKPEQKTYQINGKVWLVDDDAFILKWCASVLDLHGIKNSSFSSAEETLNNPWDPEVKYVLTDLRMPGMNGAEMCKRLRKVVPPDVKFFVLTAQALPEEREKLMEMGFDGILMKPFHSNELLDILEVNSVERISEPASLDLSSLQEMTFGDEGMIREVLEQFVKDSQHDIVALKDSMDRKDENGVMELSHKLAGRTGQIGAKDVSARFRHMEMAIKNNAHKPQDTEILELTGMLEGLIITVEEKIYSYSI